MPDMKHFIVMAYSPVDDEFKPVPARSLKQVIDALRQWVDYRQPILIAYRCKTSSIFRVVLSTQHFCFMVLFKRRRFENVPISTNKRP